MKVPKKSKKVNFHQVPEEVKTFKTFCSRSTFDLICGQFLFCHLIKVVFD